MPDSQKADVETIKQLIRDLWRDIPRPNVISAFNDDEARICIAALSGKTYEEMPFEDSPFYGTNAFEACTPEANCYFLAGHLLFALDLGVENPFHFSTDMPVIWLHNFLSGRSLYWDTYKLLVEARAQLIPGIVTYLEYISENVAPLRLKKEEVDSHLSIWKNPAQRLPLARDF